MLYVISEHVPCVHTQHEMLAVIGAILSFSPESQGCVVEAGSFKGGSGAKLSLACKLTRRRLILFDSFEGIPESEDSHDRNIYGGKAFFKSGSYCGTLEEVQNNISKYGELGVCEMVKGWFEDTMPEFREPVIVAYLDVDLASSTRTCLKYLYPRIVPGGTLYSQDGHLHAIIELFRNSDFWEGELNSQKPPVEGLGKQKLIKVIKPDHSGS